MEIVFLGTSSGTPTRTRNVSGVVVRQDNSKAYAFSEKNIRPRLDVEKLQQAGITQGPLWGRIQQGEDFSLPDGRFIQAKNFLQSARSPRKIIIAGDNDTPGLLAECAKTAQVLVHESTYTQEVAIKVGSEPQHSSAKIVSQLADECAIENLVLTHLVHVIRTMSRIHRPSPISKPKPNAFITATCF